ncbi:MAG: CARDB domain-containing protein, partial [Candidatus Thermoplasmatota archaeon]
AEGPYGGRDLTVESEDHSDSVAIKVPYFKVEITEPIEGQKFIEDEPVTVRYTVKNTGNSTDIQDIEFYLDGNKSDITRNLGLDGGEIYEGYFRWISEKPYGERNLTVQSEGDSDEVTVLALEDPYFEVSMTKPVGGGEHIEGETITIEFSVENIGYITDTQDVGFYVNGELVDRVEEVTLESGSTYTREFTWTVEGSNGDCELAIESEDHSDSVTITILEDNSSDGLFSDGCWSYLILATAILALILAGVLYKRQTAKKEPVIEDVFLISKRNSMLLLHNTRRLRPDRDSDIIAGMFEAVQNFIEDSFQDTGDWELNKLEFGGNNIVVERGEHVYMAVVYEGDLSEEEIQEIRDVIDSIEDEFGEELKEWDGDREELRGLKDLTQDLFS